VGFLGQIAATLKSGLDAALAPAADPRATYVSANQKQQALLAQVGLAMSQVTASKVRLQERAREDRAKLPEMMDEARAELLAGRPDAARALLQRRQVLRQELEVLEAQLAEVEKDQANLKALQRRLANQVDEFVARQEMIVARYNAAEAQVQIKEAVSGVSKEFSELTAALEQAEERTEGMEARVSAIDRLVREGMLAQGPPGLSRGAVSGEDVEAQLADLQSEITPPAQS
jgi:phage shock protein A